MQVQPNAEQLLPPLLLKFASVKCEASRGVNSLSEKCELVYKESVAYYKRMTERRMGLNILTTDFCSALGQFGVNVPNICFHGSHSIHIEAFNKLVNPNNLHAFIRHRLDRDAELEGMFQVNSGSRTKLTSHSELLFAHLNVATGAVSSGASPFLFGKFLCVCYCSVYARR